MKHPKDVLTFLQNSPLLAQSPINQLLLLDDARVKADDKVITKRIVITTADSSFQNNVGVCACIMMK